MRVNKIEKFVLELSDEEKEHLKSLLESSDLDDVVEVEEEDEIDVTFEDLNNIQEVIQNIEAELSDIKSTLGLE